MSGIQSKMQKLCTKLTKMLVQYIINNKPLCRETMLEDMEAFAYEAEMFTMLCFYSHKAEDSLKHISEFAANEFHSKLFYQVLSSQGQKKVEKHLVKDNYALMKNVAGTVS